MQSGQQSHLKRLDPSFYQGHTFVHWSMTIEQRKQGWLTQNFHAQFRELLLHTCARYEVCIPCYCLMPDHMHLLVCGLSESTDQRKAMRFLRRQTNRILAPEHQLQKQAHDHVLTEKERESDAFQSVAYYIFNNPVRSNLIPDDSPFDWPYSGCIVVGYPDLDPPAEDYWDKFWSIYRRITS